MAGAGSGADVPDPLAILAGVSAKFLGPVGIVAQGAATYAETGSLIETAKDTGANIVGGVLGFVARKAVCVAGGPVTIGVCAAATTGAGIVAPEFVP